MQKQQINNHSYVDASSKCNSKPVYSAPQLTILGNAQELTKSNENCKDCDAAVPGVVGCDACS